MIARYGLLECGKNYKGTIKEKCVQCDTMDDEDHRLNRCPNWRENNLYDSVEKVDFADIYSNDLQTIRNINVHLEKVWDTRNSNGSMHT